MPTVRSRSAAILCLTLSVLQVLVPTIAAALPNGGQVVGGQATINQPTSKSLQIQQSTDKAIINWQQFSIAGNEAVRFSQPSVNSIALNRVVGVDPSVILGQLQANGRIFLINPNGILFGAGSQINVGALLATTLQIRNEDFMAGRYLFAQDPMKALGTVINQGTIHVSDHGFAVLVAPGVANEGVIVANLGTTVLGSAQKLTLDLMGDGLINYALSGKVLDQVKGPDGKPLNFAVSNTGTIQADGGQVILSARASGDIFSSVVNQSGVIRAQSLVNQGGVVRLEGSDPVTNTSTVGWQANLGKVQNADGKVINTGTIDVSAGETGAAQGQVTITGEMVGVAGTILARGAEGAQGGRVLISSTEKTIATSDSVIDTSGVGNSSAGNVVVWSDRDTLFGGTILARGGAFGGNGGNVEVSGHENLGFVGQVNALAPRGAVGSLLLDPRDITVATGGGATLAEVDQFSDTPGVDQMIDPATINAAAANVTLQANNDITVTNAIAMTNAGVGMTMQAGRSIAVNADVSTNNGNISLTANDSAATAANRTAGAGNITMGAGTTLNAGTGSLSLTIGSSAVGGFTPGTITAQTLAGGAKTISVTTGTSTVSGVVSGTGGLVKNGAGTLTLSGANTYTGATTINAGTLRVAGGAAIADTSSVALSNVGGSTLDLNGTNETIGSLAGGGAGNGNVTLGAGTLTTGGNNASTTYTGIMSGTGGLTKAGTGTFTLSGANTYTGAMTINAGTLTLGAANRIADVSAVTVAGGATFNLNNFAETIGSLSGAGNVTLGTATLTTGDATNTTFSGIMSGAGGLTKQGTGIFTLSGANTYTDATLINAGTLVAAVNSALGTIAGGTTVAAGATLGFTGGINYATAEPVTLNGGTLANLAGNNTFAGPITLTANSAITVADGTTMTVGGTVNGGSQLNVTSGTGGINFLSAIGGTTPLSSLTATVGAISLGAVTTVGTQTYTGATTLNGNLTTTNSAITLNSPVTLGANVTVDTTNGGGAAAGANIAFSSALDADAAGNNRTLTLTAGTGGGITLSNAVGGSQALQTFTVTSASSASLPAITTRDGGINVTATNITLNGDLSTNATTTAGPVSLTGAVTLGANVNIRADVANGNLHTLLSEIGVGSTPVGVALTPDGALAYVANYSSNTVSVVNTATNSVVSTISVGTNPQLVAISPNGAKVYVANVGSNTVSVINTASNTVVGTITVGSAPSGVAFSPDGTRAYVANQGGTTVSVINTATNQVTGTVTVGSAPTGLAVTPDGAKAYVANRDSNTVSVINTATNTVSATITVGAGPQIAAITPDGKWAYVTNYGVNGAGTTVSVINTTTNTVAATVTVGSGPLGVAITPDGTRAYVTNYAEAGGTTLSVINTATNTVSATPTVGGGPLWVSITPDGAKAYLTTLGNGGRLQILDSNPGASGANITVTGTTNADAAGNNRTLDLYSSGGAVSLTGPVGGTQALQRFNVNRAASVTAPAITTRDGGINLTGTDITLTGNLSTNSLATAGNVNVVGAVHLGSNVAITTDAATTDANIWVKNILDADATGNNRTLTLTADQGSVILPSAIGGAQPLQTFTVTSAQQAYLPAITTRNGGIKIGDTSNPVNMTLNGNLSTNATTAGGPVSLFGPITLGSNVTMNSDAASSDGMMTILGNLDADLAANNRTLTLTAGNGNITFAGTGSGPVGASQPLETLTVTSAGNVTMPSAVTTRDGGISVAASSIWLAGNLSTNAAATAGPITLTGPVTLGSNITVTTDAATTDANITVTGTTNADAAANNRTLTFTAGGGNILLTGAVGGSQALQTFTVTGANTATLPAITTQTGGISATETTLNLNGALTTSGGGPITLNPGTALTLNQNLTAPSGTITLNPTTGGVNQTAGAITGANVLLTGTGPFTLTQAGNDVTTLAANETGAITYTDMNALTVGTVGATNGVTTTNNNATIATVNGPLTVANTAAAQDLNAGTGTVSLTAGGTNKALTITGAVTGTGGVTYTADNMTLSGTTTATGAVATLQPNTGGTLINLGGADAAGTLGLTSAELNTITAGTLHIGNPASGAMTVSASIAPTGTSTLSLESSASIAEGGSAVTIPNLALRAPIISMSGPFTSNSVGTLAASASGAAPTIVFFNGPTLAIGTVDGVAGVSAVNGLVVLGSRAGGITVNNTAAAWDVDGGTGAVTLASLTSNQALTVTGSVRGGTVNYTADNMTLTGATSAGTAASLQPTAAAVNVQLGGVDSPTVLGITQAELNTITSPLIQIASFENLSVVAPITSPAASLVLDIGIGGSGTGTITQTAGSTLTATNLGVLAIGTGAVTLNEANVVSTFAAGSPFFTTGPLQFTNAGAFSTGSVNGITGVRTTNQPITLTALNGGLTVGAAGVGDINAGAGTVALTAGGANQTLTVTGNVSGTGGVTYTADNMTLTGATTATGAIATLKPNTAGTSINLGGADAAGTLGLTSAELNTITAGTLRIGNAGSGNISISSAIAPTGTSTMSLMTGGTVTQTASVTVPNLDVQSAGAVTLTNGSNDVSTLAANVTGAGNAVTYTDTNALTVGTVDGVTGITTNNGNLTLNTGNTLTLSHNIAAGIGTVTLNPTAGGVTQTGGALTASNLLLTGAGTYTLTQAGNDVGTLAANVTGAITYTDTNALTLGNTAATGTLTVSAGGLLTATGTISATGASLTGAGITQPAGAMTIGGTTTLAAGAANDITLNNAGNDFSTVGITSGNNVALNDSNVLTLGASTVSGNLNVTAAGDLTVNSATATTGSVDLIAGGSILSGGAGPNLTAGANSTLQALNGVVGTTATPFSVVINNGTLGIRATTALSGISGFLTGTVSPGNSLTLLNVPPGVVCFNGCPVPPPPTGGSVLSGLGAGTFVYLNRDAIVPAYYQQPSGATRLTTVASTYIPGTIVAPADVSISSDNQSIARAVPPCAPESRFGCLPGRSLIPSPAAGVENVLFGFGSWQLAEEVIQGLIRIADWMKSNPTKTMTIEGHSDERGSDTYNRLLGLKRARAVQKALVGLGVNADQLNVVSYGKARPVCTEHSAACYEQNRRAHLRIIEP